MRVNLATRQQTSVFMKTLILLSLAFLSCLAPATAQTIGKGASGISGRVTLDGKPLARALVVLLPAERNGSLSERPLASATTDGEGQYIFSELAAGRYDVVPRTPAYVATNTAPRRFYVDPLGQAITVKEGEIVKDVDFKMIRGGVITGRVTDANNRPVIGETVLLKRVNEQGEKEQVHASNEISNTDDQGVYRIYGLPPGRYLVSVGVEKRGGVNMSGGVSRGAFLRQTFAPGTPDDKEARVFDLSAGQEITQADIKTGLRQRTYEARGRIVPENARAPLPKATLEVSTLDEQGRGRMNVSGYPVSANGEFILSELLPGRYRVNAEFYGESSEFYSLPAAFEITDADVGGLELKLQRGLSIEGVVALENTSSRPAPKLEDLSLSAFGIQRDSETRNAATGKPAPDGSFRLSGLRPGEIFISVSQRPDAGVHLLRVERDGVLQPNNKLELIANQPITGLRVVCAYGAGVIRGRVAVENGPLPDGVTRQITVRKTDGTPLHREPPAIDDSQQFQLKGLLPGTYELTLTVTLFRNEQTPPRIWQTKQTVVVASDNEAEATLTLDAKREGRLP